MINWNDLNKSADTLTEWFSLYELSVSEIDITSRQVDILLEQSSLFTRRKHKKDLEYLGKRLEDYERLKDVAKEEILKYANE